MVSRQSKGGAHADRIRRERGAVDRDPPETDYLSADEMLDWLRRETELVSKEAELRIRDATEFVTEYARGRMTARDADGRFVRYRSRWGDALLGIMSIDGKTDEQIVREMDRNRRSRLSANHGGEHEKVRSR